MVNIRHLNKQQKAAVLHKHGPALVIAGAGTGKTAVITMRIAHLITSKAAKAENILALTFTEKAAEEMQLRVDELLPLGYADADIMTFHGFADKILREHSLEIGLQADYSIMSRLQQLIIMREVIESTRITQYKPIASPFSFATGLLAFISRLKDDNISASNFENFVKKSKLQNTIAPTELKRQQELSRIYRKYEDLSQKKGFLDFGDLLLYTVKLLSTNRPVLEAMQRKYQFILVDEYQDTNYIQAHLVKMLYKEHQNIMVVGDDDQSIYRFRGAEISNILSFSTDTKNVKKYILKENYRSTQKILDGAYKLIKNNNPYRLEVSANISKKLIANSAGRAIVSKYYNTKQEEIDDIATQIVHLNTMRGISYKDIAILIRKNNQARAVALALQRQGVPYMLTENKNLLEQPEIKAMVSFIVSVVDPQASDAFYGLLVSDIFKISYTEIVDMSSVAKLRHISLQEFAHENPQNSRIDEVLRLIVKYRDRCTTQSAGTILYDFVKETKFLDELLAKSTKDALSVQKIQNIAQFFKVVAEFEQASSLESHIYAFWQYINQLKNNEIQLTTEASPLDSDTVSIMTVHKAKGLEFEAVFMIDLVEQVFPARRMPEQIRMPDGLFSESDQKDASLWHMLEERRLFYVAMTRAKKHLYLSFAYDGGGKRLRKPSRFILEVTGKHLPAPSLPKSNSINSIEAFATLPAIQFDPLSSFIDSSGWLHLTANQVAGYLRSPKEFWYFDVLHLPRGPAHSLVYGSAIHKAIEHYYLSRIDRNVITLKAMLEVFENNWKSEGFVSLQHEKDRLKMGTQTIRKFYAKANSSSEVPIYVEKPFTLRLQDIKTVISGRYDAIFTTKHGIEIRDFKTGDVFEQKKADAKLKDSLQMQIYYLAYAKTHNTKQIQTSLHFVDSGLRSKTDTHDEGKILQNIKLVTEGIRNKSFESKGSSRLNFDTLL